MVRLFHDFVTLSLIPFNIYCVQFWCPHYEREMDILERHQQRVMMMITRLEHLSCE